jgi:hypothetical protein
VADVPADVVLTLTAREGQYHIHSSAGMDNPWSGTSDGLFVGEDTWVAILCGTQWGPVTASVRRHDARPAEIDSGWDMVAEWTLECPRGLLTIQALYSSEQVTAFDVPAGWVRLRVSVRNRYAASTTPEPIPEPIEHHHIQYWPVPDRQDPAVIHGPDDFASLYLGQDRAD